MHLDFSTCVLVVLDSLSAVCWPLVLIFCLLTLTLLYFYCCMNVFFVVVMCVNELFGLVFMFLNQLASNCHPGDGQSISIELE